MRAITIALVVSSCLLLGAVDPQAAAASDPHLAYGDTYTSAELAALDRALWAGNMTRADLGFNKDLGKGHECFPVVREMMADPLYIAEEIDWLSFVSSRQPLGAALDFQWQVEPSMDMLSAVHPLMEGLR